MVNKLLQRRRRAVVLGLLASVTIAAVSACTEEAPIAPESPFVGTWVLETVNGAALPRVFEVLLDGSRRAVIDGEIIVRSRGRLDDTKHVILERPNGVRLDDVVDTLTAPFSATTTQLFIRRYALLADNDWVDTGTVTGESLQLRARFLEQRFGIQRNVVLGYRRVR